MLPGYKKAGSRLDFTLANNVIGTTTALEIRTNVFFVSQQQCEPILKVDLEEGKTIIRQKLILLYLFLVEMNGVFLVAFFLNVS